MPHEQPELGNIFGQSAFNSEIDYLRASLADEVAVRVGVAVIVDALVERLERRYQPHITEQAQIAVDGAEAYLRQLGAHTRIYRVRSRVIEPLLRLSEQYHAVTNISYCFLSVHNQ